MTRKDFLRSLLGLGCAPAVAAVVVACDEGGDGGGSGACDVSIGSNHGHSLSVPDSDLEAGEAKTYDIQGSSGHAHSITLTEGDFATLQDEGSVTVNSTSGGGHTHPVTVTCG